MAIWFHVTSSGFLSALPVFLPSLGSASLLHGLFVPKLFASRVRCAIRSVLAQNWDRIRVFRGVIWG